MTATGWVEWHGQYEQAGSDLADRLREVRAQIAAALDRAAPGPVRLLALCAGDGRDVLPVLAAHPRGRDVTGRLVELDATLAAAARAAAPAGITVVEADAGSTACWCPADLLMLCGIFGNISDADIARTVAAVPSILAQGGTVIWTRTRKEPDLTPSIRRWFTEAGVEETAFTGPRWSVGAGVLTGPARVFTFRR